ncbi:hypothetical protein ACU686_44635 [Yinghuangia aomiensis]
MSAIWSASSRTAISIASRLAGAAVDQVLETARGGGEDLDAALQRA